MHKPIRVMLIDDHQVVRVGLREMLCQSDDIEVVGEAGTKAEALTRLGSIGPSLLVIDVRLPDGSGMDLLREAKAQLPDLDAVMLTSYPDDDALFEAIEAGASAFILKDIKGSRLVEAIRSVAAGEALLDSQVTRRVLDRIRHQPATTPNPLESLTERELEMVRLIAEGCTNAEIGARLYLAEKTVKNSLTRLFNKLNVSSRTEAAVLAARCDHVVGNSA